MLAAILTFHAHSAWRTLWLGLGLLALVCVNSAHAAAIAQADIEAFVRDGCPHCERAEAFLAELQRERPQLNILIRNVSREPDALRRLQTLAEAQSPPAPLRLPAFRVGAKLVIGYSAETGNQLLREALAATRPADAAADAAGSCEVQTEQTCTAGDTANPLAPAEPFELALLGQRLVLDEVGLPAFTIAMGLLDGFNPCSMWVLILMVSMLAPMRNRPRMLALPELRAGRRAGLLRIYGGVVESVFMDRLVARLGNCDCRDCRCRRCAEPERFLGLGRWAVVIDPASGQARYLCADAANFAGGQSVGSVGRRGTAGYIGANRRIVLYLRLPGFVYANIDLAPVARLGLLRLFAAI